MKRKLLILLTSLFLFTGCYTTFHHVHRDIIDNEVYTYDVNFVYSWDYYDYWYDYYPYWYPYDHHYFSLNFYTIRYPQYPHWNYYKPYWKHYRPHKWNKRPFKKRHNVWNNQHYRPKRQLMNEKTIIKSRQKSRHDVVKRNKLGQKDRHSVQVKRPYKRKYTLPGHLPGQNVQKGVQVKKKERVHQTPTLKKRVQKTRKNTHVFKNSSTNKKPRSTVRTNKRNTKSRKTRR